jgi:hypothetical protein
LKNTRTFIDAYFDRLTGKGVIHEILNNKRNYLIIENFKFDFYYDDYSEIDELVPVYYKKKSELKKVTCSFNQRFNKINEIFNFKLSAIDLKNYEIKRKLTKNHRLFGSDDSPEYKLIRYYFEKYKDEIDDQPLHYCFFDIETHNEFQIEVTDELESILIWLEKNIDTTNIYEPSIIIQKKFSDKYSDILSLSTQELKDLILDIEETNEKEKYKDYKQYIFILANPKITKGIKLFIFNTLKIERAISANCTL